MTHSKIISALLAYFIFFTAIDVSAKQIPLNDFTKRSDYLDIKISPDGKHFATRVREDASVFLVIRRVNDLTIVGGVRPGSNNEVAGMYWINSERLVYTFAEKTVRQDVAIPTGELFAINLDSSANKMLAGFRASDERIGRRLSFQKDAKASHFMLNVLPDEANHVLVIEYPWSLSGNFWYDRREKPPVVSWLNIYTGKKSRRETIPYPGARVFANDEGEIKFLTYSTDSIDQIALYRSQKKDQWQDVSSALETDVASLRPKKINNDGSKMYLFGAHEQENGAIKTLFELSLESKAVHPVFDNQFPIDYWQSDENGDPVLATSYPDKHHYNYTLRNPDSAFVNYHKMLSKAFKGQEVELRTSSDDGKLLVVLVSSDVNPGEYYLFNTQTKKADFLWANYSWIDPRDLAPMTPISFKARDEQEINGYLTKSTVLESDKMIVIPHGGPHGVRNYPNYQPRVQLLANRGYNVLQINFRGSGGYGSDFEKAGYKNWGNVMVDDVIDGTRWAIEQGHADDKKVCIYGASYGGYSALMSSIKAPELFACTIGYVGVYDLELMKVKGDIPIGFRGRNYLDRVLGSDIESLKQQSPVNHAAKLKSKVFLIHGDEDKRVPSLHAKRMRKALKKVGKSPKWLYFSDGGHGVFSIKNRTKLYEEILGFLDENIGS